MRYTLIIPTLLSLLLFSPIAASADEASGTRIQLSASAMIALPNDEVVITFRVEKEGPKAAAVRQYVNRVSAAIEQRLGSETALSLKTISRQMQPVWKYTPPGKRLRTGWRMSQNSRINSSKLDAVPAWLDAIEAEGAKLSNLTFRISKHRMQQAREQLRTQAIMSFRSKAAAIARALHVSSYKIIRLNSRGHAPQVPVYRQPVAMMMSKSAESSPPALAAGKGELSVTVSGEIETPYNSYKVK